MQELATPARNALRRNGAIPLCESRLQQAQKRWVIGGVVVRGMNIVQGDACVAHGFQATLQPPTICHTICRIDSSNRISSKVSPALTKAITFIAETALPIALRTHLSSALSLGWVPQAIYTIPKRQIFTIFYFCICFCQGKRAPTSIEAMANFWWFWDGLYLDSVRAHVCIRASGRTQVFRQASGRMRGLFLARHKLALGYSMRQRHDLPNYASATSLSTSFRYLISLMTS